MSSHRKRRRVSFPRAQRLQITFSLFIADLDICVRVRERGQQKNLAAMSMADDDDEDFYTFLIIRFSLLR